MYNNQEKKTTKKSKDTRPKNISLSVGLFKKAKLANGLEYNKTELIDTLNGIPFSKISIPIYTYKNLIFNEDSKGTMVVGYVNSFDPETETFNIVIYGNYVETIKAFEDKVIYPRLFLDNETNAIKIIVSLDICPEDVLNIN